MLTLAAVQSAMVSKLAGSALTDADARKMKLKATTAKDSVALKLPAVAAGFVIPYFTPEGKVSKFFRYRYLEETRKGFDVLSGKKPLRYGQPSNTINEVYLPPFIPWKDYLASSAPLLITEGELKAACATALGIPTMGLGGVWCFMNSKHNLPLLPLFDTISWEKRLVGICYDSDAVTNSDVVRAENILAKRLTDLGAVVQIVRLPPEEDGTKVGLDDYLVAHGPQKFMSEILASAFDFVPCAALHALSERVVYVRNPGLVYSHEHDMRMAPAAFIQHAYAHVLHKEQTTDAQGNVKMKDVQTAVAWMKWPKRAELRGMTYAPGQPRTTERNELNTWKGWGVKQAVKGDVGPWKELLDHLFGKGANPAREWFERWCAYPIQHPGTKMASAAVMWGVTHGSGKTLVGHTLMKLYGVNSTEVKDADLEDARFEWAEDKQFVLADDVTGHDNRKLSRRFMTMITQKQIRLNIKYVPSYTIPDCINYYFTSNDPDAFFMDDEDRRFFIWEVLAGKLPVELRKRFVAWRESTEGQEALMYYMSNLPLGDFDPQAEAMQTSAKKEMTRISKSELGVWVSNLKESPETFLNGKLKGDLFTAEELHALYDPLGDKRATPNAMARELKRAGFKAPATGSPLNIGTGMRRAYAIKNPDYWKAATWGKAVEHYVESRKITLLKTKY